MSIKGSATRSVHATLDKSNSHISCPCNLQGNSYYTIIDPTPNSYDIHKKKTSVTALTFHVFFCRQGRVSNGINNVMDIGSRGRNPMGFCIEFREPWMVGWEAIAFICDDIWLNIALCFIYYLWIVKILGKYITGISRCFLHCFEFNIILHMPFTSRECNLFRNLTRDKRNSFIPFPNVLAKNEDNTQEENVNSICLFYFLNDNLECNSYRHGNWNWLTIQILSILRLFHNKALKIHESIFSNLRVK